MKNDVVQFTLCVLVLVLGGALEELLPKFLGVGFPILLSSVIFLSARRTIPFLVLFAIAAGAVEDSLSGLPMVTSASFFLMVGALSRVASVPQGALILAYPFYQPWLGLWSPGLSGGVFGRILVALPMGVCTAVLVAGLLRWVERKAAVNEA